MPKTTVLAIALLLCGFQTAVSPDIIVMKAAESQLPAVLSRIPAGRESHYGFTENDDLDGAMPGKPFRLLEFNTAFYHTAPAPATNYITIRNEWRVPVAIRDTSRCLLTMTGNPGNYLATELSAPLLAQELQQKTKGVPETDELYLLQIPGLPADIMVHEHDNSFSEAVFVPLQSAIAAIPELARKPEWTLMEIQQMVKNALAGGTSKSSEPATKPVPTKKPSGKR